MLNSVGYLKTKPNKPSEAEAYLIAEQYKDKSFFSKVKDFFGNSLSSLGKFTIVFNIKIL